VGASSKKFLAEAAHVLKEVEAHEPVHALLNTQAVQQQTAVYREKIAQAEDPQTAMAEILPSAFALVRDACRRLKGETFMVCGLPLAWDMIPYDVQVTCGLALHRGRVVEMATGEGKTLAAVFPLYLNALAGKGAHLATANDFLARRDAEWMQPLFHLLGLSVGCIQSSMDIADRRAAYACDVTYGAASEFGFDYLRDQGLVRRREEQVLRGTWFCIVDEADSVLIDESLTPLVISGLLPAGREVLFQTLQPVVASLLAQQRKLCDAFVHEACDLLASPAPSDDERHTAGIRLFQVKLGDPKNPLLSLALETPHVRQALMDTEAYLRMTRNRDQVPPLAEELIFVVDERQQHAHLTKQGRKQANPDNPDAFVIPDIATESCEIASVAGLSSEERHARQVAAEQRFAAAADTIDVLSQLLKANALLQKDVDYIVTPEGRVVIVDPRTGRPVPGSRWGQGLHQATEAKEGVPVERESRCLSTVTVQNFFRRYEKLAGMTGTATTEAVELKEVYRLEVEIIPPHRERQCIEQPDTLFRTKRDKMAAVVRAVEEAHAMGRPVLVGTGSVEASETLARMLHRAAIPFSLLNAKQHAREAEIIGAAGVKSAVTVAANMAGRGTDIKLGPGVADLGGLLVLGTERQESRRLDRQLAGRCARQGDPGETRFFLSLEDDLLRLFMTKGPMAAFIEQSMADKESFSHPLLIRAVEEAQRQVEAAQRAARKQTLSYDDVLDRQRNIVAELREQALHSAQPLDCIKEQVQEEIVRRLDAEGDRASFHEWMKVTFAVALANLGEVPAEELEAFVAQCVEAVAADYVKRNDNNAARFLFVDTLDEHWRNHLQELDDLRQSVRLRSYAQKNPLTEYQHDALRYFEAMMGAFRSDLCARFGIQAAAPERVS
jgi:preprotein translocase subunit SecA